MMLIFIKDGNICRCETFIGVPLKENSSDVHHYEIYKVNSDKSKSYLGATYNTRYFINSIKRETDEMESTFEVVSVNNDNVRGKTAKVKVEWPDNTLPKANFRAKSTVVAPGEEVTKNKKGNDEIVMEGLITVTKAAEAGLTNLSLNKNAEASSFVNDAEAPKYALDGDSSTKWCAVGPDEHNITIDLGEVKSINEV